MKVTIEVGTIEADLDDFEIGEVLLGKEIALWAREAVKEYVADTVRREVHSALLKTTLRDDIRLEAKKRLEIAVDEMRRIGL